MRAFYLHGARDLRLSEVDIPTIEADQVLVRVLATGICGSDQHYYVHSRNGDFIPGVVGAIQTSKDGGKSWAPADLPVEPNSVVYWFATNPELPETIVAGSLYGYVYVTDPGNG